MTILPSLENNFGFVEIYFLQNHFALLKTGTCLIGKMLLIGISHHFNSGVLVFLSTNKTLPPVITHEDPH